MRIAGDVGFDRVDGRLGEADRALPATSWPDFGGFDDSDGAGVALPDRRRGPAAVEGDVGGELFPGGQGEGDRRAPYARRAHLRGLDEPFGSGEEALAAPAFPDDDRGAGRVDGDPGAF